MLNEMWLTWSAAAIPKTASIDQRLTAKTAFMSGVAAALGQIARLAPRENDTENFELEINSGNINTLLIESIQWAGEQAGVGIGTSPLIIPGTLN